MKLNVPAALVAVFALAACSGGGSSAPPAAAPPAKQESVFKAQTDAIDKAKQVEQVTRQQAEQEKKQVEEQTQ